MVKYPISMGFPLVVFHFYERLAARAKIKHARTLISGLA